MIDSYKALPLGVYERCLEVRGDDNEVTLGVLAILSGRTVDELMDMPLEDYYAIRAKGAFMLLQPVAVPIRASYTCGEWELVPVRKLRELTTAQFIDFKEWSAQKGTHRAETLSCFLTPKGHTYGEGYDPEEVIAAIREHMSVEDAHSLDAFFFSLSLRSMSAILAYFLRRLTPRERLTKEARTMRRALRDLRRSGAGWRRWTPLLSLPARLGGRSTRSPY